MGDSTLPLCLSILLPTAFAALLGYFMFYGRISDAYVGVITLTVTVILFNVVNSTAGDVYHIGNAPARRLQRHAVGPATQLPGDPSTPLGPDELWYVSVGCLLLVYAILRADPGQPLRPRRGRDPRERDPRDAARLRPAGCTS